VAKKTRSTFKKRQKEMARQQKRRDKLARRLERSKSRQEAPVDRLGGEDPDIAGIIPGPQPPREDER
jgi:hypothetical protein